MPEFEVTVVREQTGFVTVRAKDEDAAIEKVSNMNTNEMEKEVSWDEDNWTAEEATEV